jgi:hypothetical protein
MYSISRTPAAAASETIVRYWSNLQTALQAFEDMDCEKGETMVLRDTRTDSVLVIYREEFAHVTVAA